MFGDKNKYIIAAVLVVLVVLIFTIPKYKENLISKSEYSLINRGLNLGGDSSYLSGLSILDRAENANKTSDII